MSIMVELENACQSLIERCNSNEFVDAMYKDILDILANHDIGVEYFADEDEFDQFIGNLVYETEKSTSLDFHPTLGLIELLVDLNSKIEKKKIGDYVWTENQDLNL